MLYIEHNLLLIHMRKTGGTSLSKVLGEGDDRLFSSAASFSENAAKLKGIVKEPFQTDKHTPLRVYRKHLHEDYFRQLRIVATARNPWSRMVSAYFWMKQKKWGKCEGMLDAREFLLMVSQQHGLEHYVCTHRWMQAPVLGHFRNPLACARVSRYLHQETLEKDFAALCSDLHIACPPLGKWNMSAHGEWRSYYNEEMKRAVARKFRHEICFFGYRFEGDASF
jgi:hypothetical protein